MAAKPARNKAKKKAKVKQGGLPRSFFVALTALVVLPLTALVGWYVYTAVIETSEAARKAERQLAGELGNLAQGAADLAKRAAKQGFSVDDVNACAQITDQYKIPQGFVVTKFTMRQLVGLPGTASAEEVQERCVHFAKAVADMEKLAHHDRHVFVCQKGRFMTDSRGTYYLTADPQGRGVVEHLGDTAQLRPISPGRSALVKNWQVYNLGDGCIIVGLSKKGIFEMHGSVDLDS